MSSSYRYQEVNTFIKVRYKEYFLKHHNKVSEHLHVSCMVVDRRVAVQVPLGRTHVFEYTCSVHLTFFISPDYFVFLFSH